MNNFEDVVHSMISAINSKLNSGMPWQEVYGAISAVHASMQEAYFNHLRESRLMAIKLKDELSDSPISINKYS